jgi:hypothetical protein
LESCGLLVQGTCGEGQYLYPPIKMDFWQDEKICHH